MVLMSFTRDNLGLTIVCVRTVILSHSDLGDVHSATTGSRLSQDAGSCATLTSGPSSHQTSARKRERSKGKFYRAWLLAALNLHDAIIVITLITAQLKTKIQTNLGIKYHRQVIYVQSVPPLDQN